MAAPSFHFSSIWQSVGSRTALAAAAALCAAGAAQAQETFKVGVVSFLSGQAAESFGIPAVNGAKVVIDQVSLGFLTGSEIDFVDDLIGSSFRINNPQATAACGCGTSFSI